MRQDGQKRPKFACTTLVDKVMTYFWHFDFDCEDFLVAQVSVELVKTKRDKQTP